jgi:hypothetical protein
MRRYSNFHVPKVVYNFLTQPIPPERNFFDLNLQKQKLYGTITLVKKSQEQLRKVKKLNI